MERQYTVKEVAETIRKTPDMVRRYCRSGKLKARPTGSGNWLIAESALVEFMTGETPKEAQVGSTGENHSDSPEVRVQRDATEIADLKAKEAEAVAKAAEFRQKVENQDAIIAEAIKREKELLNEATQEYTRSATANKLMAERFESDNVKLRELAGMQKTHIEELESLVEIKKEEEAKVLSDTEYYNEHVEQGKQHLSKIAKNMMPFHKGLADYLNRQVGRLGDGVGYEQGMRVFVACSTNIVKSAMWFQDNGDDIKEYDASGICDYLCKADERLRVVMGILWEVDKSKEEEPMMVQGEQGNILGRILQKMKK